MNQSSAVSSLEEVGYPFFFSIFLWKELSKITINTKTVVLPLNIAIITII